MSAPNGSGVKDGVKATVWVSCDHMVCVCNGGVGVSVPCASGGN